MKAVSRTEAKQAGLTGYFTGEPCKHGHVAERYVGGNKCVVCTANDAKAWRRANPEGMRAIEARRNEKHGKAGDRMRAWRKDNPARTRVHSVLSQSKRRAALLNRTPKWASFTDIEQTYLDAQEFRAAGMDVEVDHIVPLQGDIVCGLHVHHNLRVILKSANRSKQNFFELS